MSVEILQVLYRQFIVYVACLIFPWAGMVGLLGLVIEMVVSRALMLRLTKRPPFINQRLGSFFFWWMMIIAVAAVVYYPNGAVWMLFAPGALPNAPTYRNCSIMFALYRVSDVL